MELSKVVGPNSSKSWTGDLVTRGFRMISADIRMISAIGKGPKNDMIDDKSSFSPMEKHHHF